MNIGDAVAAIGREETATDELAIARVHQGRMLHATLAQCRDRPLESLGDVWIAAGAFTRGSIQTFAGRTKDNLSRVIDLSFDFDLTDFTGASKTDIHAASDGELAIYLRSLAADAEELLSLARIPFTLSIGTGYGLLYLSRLAVPDQLRLADAGNLYPALVDRINELHGGRIVDPQVKDAGTRLIRLPGCVNTKGTVPRPCMIIEERGDLLHLDDFEVTERVSAPPRRIIPAHGKELSQEDEHDIVLALNGEWADGSRHGIALGIAGLLAKAGVPEGQTARIISTVGAADPELRDRLNAVSTTYKRIGSGLDVRGYYQLRDFLSPDALAFIDNKLSDRYQPQSLGVIDFPLTEEREARAPRQAFSACPEEAFYGWFGAYCDLMLPTTEAPACYHLGSALVFAGMIMGRGLYTDYAGKLFPNLFVCLVGKTGKSKKSTAMNRAKKEFFLARYVDDRIVVPPNLVEGVSSAEGILDQLLDFSQPNAIMFLHEFSDLMRITRRQGLTNLTTILTQLWDGDSKDRNKAGKEGRTRVENPCFSVLAATTPQTLIDDMTKEDITSGFANRFLWFFGQGRERIARPPSPDQAQCERLYGELLRAIYSLPEGAFIPLTRRANALWEDYYENDTSEDGSEEDAMLAQRLGAYIHKVSLIYAASDGVREIDEDHLTAAIALVRWSFDVARTQAGRWGWEGEAKIASDIREALACGPMRTADISRWVGDRVPPPTLDRTLKAMLNTSQLRKTIEGYELT